MEISVKGKVYSLPIFMPDATRASIKGLDSISLRETGIKGLVTNTYHLLVDEVVETVENAGGIKKFMNFSGLVITDSGGFQAMSLVRKNKANGRFTEDGVIFKNPKDGSRVLLSPESCIETQIKLGSDIIMVLDDCTDPSESYAEQVISIDRTINWAKRCKNTYNELTKNMQPTEKPLIFGIIQGGNYKELRKKCAEGLIEIGFDGFAYGGWPLENKILLSEILSYTAELMPNDKPKYAMGVGKPNDILKCLKMSYNMFDCVIPTRDARHGRLYIKNEHTYETLNIGKEHFVNDLSAISKECNCFTCQNFTKSYLRHLFKVRENAFASLATIHNLYTFAHLF